MSKNGTNAFYIRERLRLITKKSASQSCGRKLTTSSCFYFAFVSSDFSLLFILQAFLVAIALVILWLLFMVMVIMCVYVCVFRFLLVVEFGYRFAMRF